jgi:hypothetical protein
LYQLTIARTGGPAITTGHPDAAGAYRTLLAHAVDADLYLDGPPPAPGRPATRFDLVELDEHQRGSRIVGTATITAESRS